MSSSLRHGNREDQTCLHGEPATHLISWWDGLVDLACSAEVNSVRRWCSALATIKDFDPTDSDDFTLVQQPGINEWLRNSS